MTVLDTIKRSADFFAKKGVDSPRLQVELLLAHVLRVPRMQLYLNFERVLTVKELDELRELVKRRGEREPLQHIIGSTCFCGLDLVVTKDVLVPRPETELLAEEGWKFLNSKRETQTADTKISALDFGTGSGCLAIALAAKSPDAGIMALDASTEALAIAQKNATTNKVGSRIQFFQGDGFDALKSQHEFDLIMSNPPYIPTGEIATLQPEVRDFDPHMALDGGVDGLDFYRRLAGKSHGWLKSQGRIMLELGDGQADAVQKIFAGQKWVVEAVKADYNRVPRILIAGH